MSTEVKDTSKDKEKLDFSLFYIGAANLTTNCVLAELNMVKIYLDRLIELNSGKDSENLVINDPSSTESLIEKALNAIVQVNFTISILERDLGSSETQLIKLKESLYRFRFWNKVR